MPNRCLVVGNGVIGKHLKTLSNSKIQFVTTQRENPRCEQFLDLSRPISESNVNFDIYDYVVIAAGIGGEVNCRNNLELARLVNVEGTLATIVEGVKHGCRIVFISSSYLSGIGKFPDQHKETFPYTYHKWIIETKLQNLDSRTLIFRPGKVIHPGMDIFRTISSNKARKIITNVNSKYLFSPTSINNLGMVLSKLLIRDFVGEFNLVAERSISFFELAQYWCMIMNYSPDIIRPVEESLQLRDTSLSHSLSASDLELIGERQESIQEMMGNLLCIS